MLLFQIMSTSCWNSNVAGERVQKDHSGGAGDPLSVLLSRGKLVPDVYNTAVGRAFIVSVIGHSYLVSLLPLLLTIPSYLSTTPAVLAPVVRGREDVRPGQHLPYHSPLGKTFSRCLIRVLKMRSCAEPPVCGDVRLVLKVG
ncbi:hypothetical protein BHE74_00023110 [Ensete ventricosum]|nr:hypothetical protein BHE74_00023110 [Ensete ventricosum]